MFREMEFILANGCTGFQLSESGRSIKPRSSRSAVLSAVAYQPASSSMRCEVRVKQPANATCKKIDRRLVVERAMIELTPACCNMTALGLL